jgi:hypothetical protein
VREMLCRASEVATRPGRAQGSWMHEPHRTVVGQGQRQAHRDVPRDDPESGLDQMSLRDGVAEIDWCRGWLRIGGDGVAGCGVGSRLLCCAVLCCAVLCCAVLCPNAVALYCIPYAAQVGARGNKQATR